MNNIDFKGTGVAIVTPFSNSGEIDYNALENIINHIIDGGVDYIVSMGTTGESVTLSQKERLQVLEFTAQKVGNRIGLVAGFGSNDTEGLLRNISTFHFENFDAILSVGPYYNKPQQEGFFRHYMKIADASPVPVILYNVPGRTGSNLDAKTTLRLANQHENIIGIKEASGSLTQCMHLAEERPEDFFLISGDDLLTLPLLSIGFDGVISVIANAWPGEMAQLVNSMILKDIESAQSLHTSMFNLMNLIFEEGNPSGIKCVLSEMKLCENAVRLPMIAVSEKLKKNIRAAMRVLAGKSPVHPS